MIATQENRTATQGPVARRLYTYEELAAELPETNQPCEFWDGELVISPAPSFYHQEIAFRFHERLNRFVSHHGLGKVAGALIDMVLSPHRAVQPDVAYIAKERLDIIQRVIMGPADLVAEVISPGGRNRDRIEKRDLYEQYGIKEYWMIDPEAETVEVLFRQGGQYQLSMRRGKGEQAASSLLPGFEVSVDHLFHGE